jgi:hypothetical protein
MDEIVLAEQPSQKLVNPLGASLVEVTSRLSQARAMTVVTHDFSEPTTWYQGSTEVQDEELSHEGAGVYASDHAIWINVEHPLLFADEQLDVAAWVTAGMPGVLDPYYRSWFTDTGTLLFRNHYYPVVEVQPGGTGDWVEVAPNHTDTGANPVYGHTFDYTLGKIHFNDITNWVANTKVRASYFYTEATAARSLFKIGPPAGKIWHLITTEVQLSKGTSWQDTVTFYGLQSGLATRRTATCSLRPPHLKGPLRWRAVTRRILKHGQQVQTTGGCTGAARVSETKAKCCQSPHGSTRCRSASTGTQDSK